MIDIDNFKNYNDTYGHAAGDNALQAVAACLKENLRCSDEIFRWGGEEIVVVVIEQNLPQTLLVAEKLREAIIALQIEHRGCERGYLSISSGVAAFREDCSDKEWETILERADKALYEAKETGRNKVCYMDGSLGNYGALSLHK
jgi:diguanylate cyclase (GGDEF)-like protein